MPGGQTYLAAVLLNLPRRISVPLNFEAIVRLAGHPGTAMPLVTPPTGPCPLGDLLRSFKKVYPPLHWLDDGTHVNVIIPLDSGVPDPLDDKIPVDGEGSRTMVGWIGWLDTVDKNLRLISPLVQGGIVGMHFPDPMISAHFRKGTKVRTILNQLSDSLHESWNAGVYHEGLMAIQSAQPPKLSDFPSSGVPEIEVFFWPRLAEPPAADGGGKSAK